MSRDPFFGGPPEESLATRVERAACQTALRMAGIPVGRVLRTAGQVRLTFAVLAEHVEFPRTPAVSGAQPDAFDVLFNRFRKSRVWVEWVAAWDATPVRPGRRAMVMRGVGYGLVVVHDARAGVDRPHLLVGHDVCTGGLVIEPFASWCTAAGWPPRPPDDPTA